MRSSIRRVLKTTGFFIAISLISVLLLEVVLRMMMRFELLDEHLPLAAVLRTSGIPDGWKSVSGDPLFRRSGDPILEYELIPGSSRDHIAINTFGFRGKEISALPAEGVVRIAVIGDSETFGAHLAEPDTFSEQIRSRLEEIWSGRVFEVLNCGVPGYNTLQEDRLLRSRILPLAPHVVMLRYSFNDPAIGEPQLLVDGGLLAKSHVWLSWRLLRRPVTPLSAIWNAHEGDWPGFFLALHRSPYFGAVEKLLISMAEDLERLGIPFVLFVEPELSAGIHRNYPYDEIHDSLRTLADGRFPVIDCLRPLREGCADAKELWFSNSDPHKNALGNRIQGRFAADGLVPVLEGLPLHP